MTELVDHLANLTALRDRDSLDMALVTAVMDVLQPLSSAICRVVGEPGNERWRICAEQFAGQAARCDCAWSELDSLPPVQHFPLRQLALASHKLEQTTQGSTTTVFPLIGTPGGQGVLEIITETPLPDALQQLVCGILRLYSNFSNLLDYGERDSLTELLNRKTFDGSFLKATINQQESSLPTPEVGAAQGERRDIKLAGSYWLAMIDIDHFKRVNDNYGHLIGDEVLLLLARLMRAHFRFHDQLYRFGGEEFVVLMRCQGEAESAKVLERLRSLTQQYPFPQVGSIGISIGFTEIKPGDSPSGAFERADKAVYYAKEHGRNQVCSYADLVSTGEVAELPSNQGDMELF
jgi:diguanylate cyclase (GGDEF)-like protein